MGLPLEIIHHLGVYFNKETLNPKALTQSSLGVVLSFFAGGGLVLSGRSPFFKHVQTSDSPNSSDVLPNRIVSHRNGLAQGIAGLERQRFPTRRILGDQSMCSDSSSAQLDRKLLYLLFRRHLQDWNVQQLLQNGSIMVHQFKLRNPVCRSWGVSKCVETHATSHELSSPALQSGVPGHWAFDTSTQDQAP